MFLLLKKLLTNPVIRKYMSGSVQFSCRVVSDSLWPHGLQHARPPCPSPTPRVDSNSCPLSQWYHPTISSSVIPFSFHLQSFPASGSFQMCQHFSSDSQSIGVSVSTSVPPVNIQDWFHLGWTSWISLQSKGLSRSLLQHHSSKASFLWNSAFFIVQFSDSLKPHELQHARPPCPLPIPGVYPNSCPLSWWYHPTISFSVVSFSSCLQSFPASGSSQMSQFFTSGGQGIGVSASASVLPMNIQDWFPLGWTGWISLQFKGLSRVFSSTIVQTHQLLSAQLSS